LPLIALRHSQHPDSVSFSTFSQNLCSIGFIARCFFMLAATSNVIPMTELTGNAEPVGDGAFPLINKQNG